MLSLFILPTNNLTMQLKALHSQNPPQCQRCESRRIHRLNAKYHQWDLQLFLLGNRLKDALKLVLSIKIYSLILQTTWRQIWSTWINKTYTGLECWPSIKEWDEGHISTCIKMKLTLASFLDSAAIFSEWCHSGTVKNWVVEAIISPSDSPMFN